MITILGSIGNTVGRTHMSMEISTLTVNKKMFV